MRGPGDAAAPGWETEGERINLVGDRGQSTGSADTERALAGALLWATPADAARVLDALADDDFLDPLCRFVVATVRRMVAAAVPASPITLDAFARRHALDVPNPGRHLLAELHALASDSPPPAMLDYLAGIVVEQSARRKGAALAGRLARIFAGADVAELAGEVRRLVGEILDQADRERVTL